MVKRVVVSWADRHLIAGWRDARRLWSIRINLLIGVAATTNMYLTNAGALAIAGNSLRVSTSSTPVNGGTPTTGVAGEIRWDASYVYVCTAANTWKRAALSSF